MIPVAEAAQRSRSGKLLWQHSGRGAANYYDDIPLPFDLPAVARKKVSAAFDGGRITSDGGVMLLAQAERRLGIADQLARVIPDERDADRVVHLLPDILRARIFAIACGYEDADDLDRLRSDPALKLWPLTRYRPGPLLAADRLALGECSEPARSHPPGGRDDRPLLCQLRQAARCRDA